MATFTKITDFVGYLVNAANLSSDTFRVALSNTAPGSESSNPTADGNGLLANVTQISYTNYSDDLASDRVLEGVTAAETAGTVNLDCDNFIITASGGTLADWRYLYVYDDTVAGDPLVGVWDYGATISLTDGSSANININASGLLTIT